MATTTFTCNKDARVADNGSSLGAGKSNFNPFGTYGGYQYRTLLGFSYSFSGMVTITSAILHFRTSTQYYIGFGSDPDLAVRRLSSSWSEGTSVSLSGSNDVEWSNQPGVTGATHTADVSTSESTWDTIDITTTMEEARVAGTFYGLRLYAWNGTAESSSSSDVGEIYSREQGTSDPYIDITYSTNTAPLTPITLSPIGGGTASGGVTPLIEFTHSDSDGDALLDWDLQVSTDATFASVTHLNLVAQTGSITGSDVNYTYAGTALTRGSTYYWRARTSSATGILTESAWTAAQSFKVNTLPTVTFVSPSHADALVEMTFTPGSGVAPRMVIRWTFGDADGGAQKKYRVITLTSPATAFDDSGTITSSASSYTVPVDPTRGGVYRVEVIVTDQNDETQTTGQRGLKVQWGLAEYRVDLGSTVTAWAASPTSTGGAGKLVAVEYASSAAGTAITTWYSTLASAALAQWFHWRVYLFAWGSGATSPQMDRMSLFYTNAAGVPPDGWTVSAQWKLDTATRVYGTQSLKGTGNSTTLRAYQSVPVEPNTDYILSGRVKSDGNSGARIGLAATSAGTSVAGSTTVTATQDFTRSKTGIWNSASNSSVYVFCEITGTASTYAWFDALKMEASRVVTPWTPGFVGTGVSIDVGGVQIDATPAGGAVMRLQASTGAARDRVELGTHGLLFGGDLQLYSPLAKQWNMGDAGIVMGGTAFPASPATDLRYYRTDLDREFFYDGTRWLSSQVFSLSFTDLAGGVSATGAALSHAVPTATGISDIWYIEVVDQFIVQSGGSALDSTHKWNITNYHRNGNTSGTNSAAWASRDIASGSSDVWRTLTTTIGSVGPASGPWNAIATYWTKTLGPGNLQALSTLTYRYIAV